MGFGYIYPNYQCKYILEYIVRQDSAVRVISWWAKRRQKWNLEWKWKLGKRQICDRWRVARRWCQKSADLSSCRVNILIHLIPHHLKTLQVAFKTSWVWRYRNNAFLENIYFWGDYGMKKIGLQQQCQVHDVSICLSTKGSYKGWSFVNRQTDIWNENVFVRNKQKTYVYIRIHVFFWILNHYQIQFLRQPSLVFGRLPTPECDFASRFRSFSSLSPTSPGCTPCSYVCKQQVSKREW